MNNDQPVKKRGRINWIRLIIITLIGFLSGLAATFIVLHTMGITPSTNSSEPTTVSKVAYENKTPTTEAVKKVQNAVVSVINYQKNSSSNASFRSFSDFFNQRQDDSGENSLNKDSDLEVYGEGSGVIYKKNSKYAYLVTNNHVISGAEKIEILLADGTKVVGKLMGADTYSDLAVVRISSDKVETIAQFADSSKLTVGEPAIAIGSPLGSEYANSVTEGIVSSLSRTVTSTNDNGETISTNAIQTDAAINPGNSGGALINIEGQVIGINSSKITATNASSAGVAVEGMGFAIPSNDVVSIISQLEDKGTVIRPALGISMANLSQLSTTAIEQLKIPSDVTSGIVVASVQSGLPAHGKLEKYDVITEIDGKEVDSTSDLQSLLYKHQVGDSIKITFYRGSDKKTETLKLDKSNQDLSKQIAE